jgi:transcriptional regulator
MVLQTLKTIGPQHGYGIARRIEQVSRGALELNQGTLYPALVKLEHQGWIKARWGTSDNNRKAKFYGLTPRGERQLAAEASKWTLVTSVVGRFLEDPGDA